MDLESIIKLDELERKGYLAQIRKLAMYPTCAVFWSTGVRQSGSQIIANGTMTFIQLNNLIIGVTNCHVFEGFMTSKRIFGDTKCQIGGASIDLEECLISSNKNSDLATFMISEIILNQAGCGFHSTPEWPKNQFQLEIV